MRGDARLRGRERIISSKTMRCAAPPRPLYAPCTGAALLRPRMRPCRGAEALGYARRRPPARARADYLFEDHQPAGGALLSVIVYRLFLSPTASSLIGYWLSAIGYRLSAIGYRLSAIGYRLSAIVQCHFDDTLRRRSLTGSAAAFCSPRNPGAGFTRLSSDAEKIMHWRRDCPGRSPGGATAPAAQVWSENDRPPGSALLPVTLANNMP